MDISHLYYLLEVEKCRSINKASSCCYLSSQQLSRIIRQIEQEYAITIFERTNLGLKPTAQGLQFLQEVKALLKQDEFLHEHCWNADAPPECLSGTLHVCCSINIWDRTKNCLTDFARKNPLVKIFYQTAPAAEILNQLSEQEHAVGLYIRMLLDGDQYLDELPEPYAFIPLSKQRLSVYCSNKHPLLQQYKSVSLKNLNQEPLILYQPYSGEDHRLKQIFQYVGNDSPHIQYVTSERHIFFSLLENTSCIHIGSYFSAHKRNDRLCTIPIREHFDQEYGLLIHQNARHSPLVQAFCQAFEQYYANLS